MLCTGLEKCEICGSSCRSKFYGPGPVPKKALSLAHTGGSFAVDYLIVPEKQSCQEQLKSQRVRVSLMWHGPRLFQMECQDLGLDRALNESEWRE